MERNKPKIGRWLGVLAAVLIPAIATAALTIPNTFTAGTVIKSADVNANFAAVATSVNADGTNIGSLQNSVAALQTTVTSLQTTVTSLQTTVTSQQATITSLQTSVNTLNAEPHVVGGSTSRTGVSRRMVARARQVRPSRMATPVIPR